jgi:hypothetical protein
MLKCAKHLSCLFNEVNQVGATPVYSTDASFIYVLLSRGSIGISTGRITACSMPARGILQQLPHAFASRVTYLYHPTPTHTYMVGVGRIYISPKMF